LQKELDQTTVSTPFNKEATCDAEKEGEDDSQGASSMKTTPKTLSHSPMNRKTIEEELKLAELSEASMDIELDKEEEDSWREPSPSIDNAKLKKHKLREDEIYDPNKKPKKEQPEGKSAGTGSNTTSRGYELSSHNDDSFALDLAKKAFATKKTKRVLANPHPSRFRQA
jgi:hypothetical protein